MRELEDALARMRNAWMAGRPALQHCPAPWRASVGEGPIAEALLASLAGQAVHAAFRPAPPAALQPRPLLPKLALPPLPDSLRARARRILADDKSAARAAEPLLLLLAARGYSIHPADWMPGPRDEWVPDLYAPWLGWTSAEERAAPDTAITLESYADWPWAERRTALRALRRGDAAAALAIVAAKAAAEPAERRVKLVEILDEGLSEADAPFLESLLADRSDRVKELARHFLARLGKGGDATPLEAELAAMLELGKTGLIARRRQLNLKKLKTAPMNLRRRELLGLVSLAGLARALGAGEMQLVESAPAGEADAVAAFVGMAAATGSDAARRALLERLLEDRSWPLAFAAPLAERLPPAERIELLPAVLAADTESLDFARGFAGPALGTVSAKAFAAAAGAHAVTSALKSALAGEEPANRALRTLLFNLGYLLDAAGAADLLARCVAAGLSPADPKLEVLHLNAALKPEAST
jgi:hypothetical protein